MTARRGSPTHARLHHVFVEHLLDLRVSTFRNKSNKTLFDAEPLSDAAGVVGSGFSGGAVLRVMIVATLL